jgi:hypothetical protein
MKLVKLATLAATAAFAAMAFIGASSASAVVTHPIIQLCKAETLLLCADGNLIKHPLKGRLLATQVGTGEFNGNFTIKCKEGSGKSTETEAFGNEKIDSQLEELTFKGCEGGCTVVEVAKNQAVSLKMGTALGNDWFLSAEKATVTFSGCTFGVACTFEGVLKLNIQMNAEGTFFEPEGAVFSKLIGGSAILCGSTGKWDKGKTTFKWTLDDVAKTTHKVYPTLLEALKNGV